MSAVLEPVQTLRYPLTPRRIVCEETAPLKLCERPITPPTTPPTSASTRQFAESWLDGSLGELLSWRLKAPTHCPTAYPGDTDERESVALSSAPSLPHSNTDLRPPSDAVLSVELSSPSERPPELEASIGKTVIGNRVGDVLQSERETPQDSADNDREELADTASAAPDQASTADGRASRAIVDFVNGQGTPRSSSIQSLSELTVTVNIASPSIYCRDNRLYVGKMRDLPCPLAVESKWTGEIRPRLIKDLLPVLQILPRCMSPEKTIIEPELCMAGYVTGTETMVQLKPTVWIRCGGKKCRKVIRKAVGDLGYLHSFSHGLVEVRIRGPRPAAASSSVVMSSSTPDERKCLVLGKKRLQVQHSTSGASACGVRLRVLTETSSTEDENILTIGGLVKVDNKIYGLTTAHGILDPPRVANKTSPLTFDSSDSTASAASDSESELGDDSDISSETDCLDEYGPPTTRPLRIYDQLGWRARASFRNQIQQLQWNDAALCGPMSHCGRGNVTGGTDEVTTSLSNADFALIDMGFSSAYQLYNEFMDPRNPDGPKLSIRGFKHNEDLNAGEVYLLTGQDQVMVGHLLDGPALFVNRNVVFHTRKIQLDAPLPMGTSGTWVVRDNLLCGVIVAVYDGDPYAHMIAADKMFEDIRAFLPSLFDSREVAIATKDDITEAYGIIVNDRAKAPSEPTTSLSRPTNQDVTMPTRIVPEPESRDSRTRSARFDYIYATYNQREQGEYWPKNKLWIALMDMFRRLGMALRKPSHLLRTLLGSLFFPILFIHREYKWLCYRWHNLRHVRHRRLFDWLITTLALLYLIASGTAIGLLAYKLIQIMGMHDFLRWDLPFAACTLVFALLLKWLWSRLMAAIWSRKLHNEELLRDHIELNSDYLVDSVQIASSGSPYDYVLAGCDDAEKYLGRPILSERSNFQ